MNVVLELNVPDVIRSLANNSQDVNFNKALESAYARQATSQRNFVDLFAEEYKKLDPGAHLSALFSTFELKEKLIRKALMIKLFPYSKKSCKAPSTTPLMYYVRV